MNDAQVPTDPQDLLIIHVRSGEIIDAGSWVYAWLETQGAARVLYVGAAAVHPAARVWLHLRDSDPEIGRVIARYPAAATEPLDVLALRLPQEVSRAETKQALIAHLSGEDLLSERYFGDPPAESVAASRQCIEHAERLAAHIAAHTAG